jgi:hypothetical protein
MGHVLAFTLFVILKAVIITMLVFCIVRPCELVGTHQCFGGTSVLGLKMLAVLFSDTLISTYKSTRRHNQEDQHCQVWR